MTYLKSFIAGLLCLLLPLESGVALATGAVPPPEAAAIETFYEEDPALAAEGEGYPEPAATVVPPEPATVATIAAVRTEPVGRRFVLTAGGDCSLAIREGWEEDPRAFAMTIESQGYSWPFSGVINVLALDDLTLVNLEGPLTESTDKQKRPINFKGDPNWVQVLLQGSVEAVTVANNHTLDYGPQGLEDTLNTVREAGIVAFGREELGIFEKNGIRVGLIGYSYPYSKKGVDIRRQVQELREAGCHLVVANFHWGSEYQYDFTAEQRKIGRAAIDAGADLVLGHHPHVLQGIEKYKDRYIVYSLGNLVFGGSLQYRDLDSFLAQFTFWVDTDSDGPQPPPEIALYPIQISAKKKAPDFRPFLPDEAEVDRILQKIRRKSYKMNGVI